VVAATEVAVESASDPGRVDGSPGVGLGMIGTEFPFGVLMGISDALRECLRLLRTVIVTMRDECGAD
jgi:hypothetical protein